MNGNSTALAISETPAVRGAIRPKLSFYHANAKGTGAAVEFELHPAHEDTEGSIFVSIATQKTVGSREGGGRVFPTFDWQNRLVVKLDIFDVAQMLQVFRGISESIADGKGLFHRSPRATSVISLEHRLDQTPGYRFEISSKPLDGADARRAAIVFSNGEALALALALEHSMAAIAFGVPAVFPRAGGAAAGREEARR